MSIIISLLEDQEHGYHQVEQPQHHLLLHVLVRDSLLEILIVQTFLLIFHHIPRYKKYNENNV